VRDQFTAAGIPANDANPENMLSHSYFDEKTYGGYAMADFSFLDDAIRGNVGVRVVKTDTLTRVNISDTSSGTPVIVPNSATSSYTNALPSFNITGSLTHNTLLRFGYGKGLTRPDLSALNPTVNVNTASGTGNVGNPDLKPQTANSFDVSLEHYFSPTDYASVDLFYKDIQGFFSGITYCQTVATAPAYSGSADNSCPTGQYLLTQTVNAQKGYARGVEVALQTFFDYDFFPKFLHDFGTASSFTYVETNAPLILNGVKTDMPQPFTSKYNYALSGFYDDGKMSARVIYTWRSDSILFGASTNPIDGRYIGAFGLLDASLSYKLPQGVSLSINASNLTNAAANRFVGEPAYATGIERQHFVNGRNFSVSLRYTFGG
jgi:TonB-dependent receptor